MANASILAMKEQHVAEIKDRLTRAQSVVMFDYRGLSPCETIFDQGLSPLLCSITAVLPLTR